MYFLVSLGGEGMWVLGEWLPAHSLPKQMCKVLPGVTPMSSTP